VQDIDPPKAALGAHRRRAARRLRITAVVTAALDFSARETFRLTQNRNATVMQRD
jgi:hypothetical protein